MNLINVLENIQCNFEDNKLCELLNFKLWEIIFLRVKTMQELGWGAPHNKVKDKARV